MSSSVFVEFRFWLLVAFSIVLPIAIYWFLLAKRAISQVTVFLFGFGLVVIAGIDVYLLRTLSAAAKLTPSLADDIVFVSELSVALYLLPAIAAGTGINLVSYVLIQHLAKAEALFNKDNPNV
jgi:hypothetical protein